MLVCSILAGLVVGFGAGVVVGMFYRNKFEGVHPTVAVSVGLFVATAVILTYVFSNPNLVITIFAKETHPSPSPIENTPSNALSSTAPTPATVSYPSTAIQGTKLKTQRQIVVGLFGSENSQHRLEEIRTKIENQGYSVVFVETFPSHPEKKRRTWVYYHPTSSNEHEARAVANVAGFGKVRYLVQSCKMSDSPDIKNACERASVILFPGN